VCNLSVLDLAGQMHATSRNLRPGDSEFEAAGLTPLPSTIVRPPRVGESPAALECVTTACFELTTRHSAPTGRFMVIGEVVGVHIADDFILDGRFDVLRAKPLSRLGYRDYAAVTSVFEMEMPD